MQPNIFMAYRLLFGGEIVIVKTFIDHMKPDDILGYCLDRLSDTVNSRGKICKGKVFEKKIK